MGLLSKCERNVSIAKALAGYSIIAAMIAFIATAGSCGAFTPAAEASPSASPGVHHNNPPSASLRANATTIRIGETAVIDGSASADPDGDALAFGWLLESRPAGSSAALTAVGLAGTSFTPDISGVYSVRLTVSDPAGKNAIASISIIAVAFSGSVVHVDAASSGAEDGSSAQPFDTISEAVAFAASGDWIQVAQGDYAENITLPGTTGLFLLGGYRSGDYSDRDPEAYPTTIRGNGAAPIIEMSFSGGPGVDIALLIDGFRVTGGQRGIRVVSEGGGGNLSVEISNNVVYGNSGLEGGDDYGGGINVNGCLAVIRGNVIRDNHCGKGAGLAIQYLGLASNTLVSGNIIENNIAHADHGGGAYLALRRGLVSGNLISGNHVGDAAYAGYGWGGGMIVDGGGYDGYDDSIYVELSDNRFIGNYAQSIGGGLFVDEGANVRLIREIFYGNATSAGDKGGAALHVDGIRRTANARTELSYCSFAGNRGAATATGNAIHVTGDPVGAIEYGSVVQADHCIFWDNLANGQADPADFFLEANTFLSLTDSTYQNGFTGSGVGTMAGCDDDAPEFLSIDPDNADFLISAIYSDRGVFGIAP